MRSLSATRQNGISAVELMIAMALGLLLMTAVGSLFVASSRSNTQLQQAAQQIENGRYAVELLTDDIKHAGFYGKYYALPNLPAAADPCEENNAALLKDAMAVPVQVFRAPDLVTRPDVTATTCDDKGLLVNANLQPGSDVIVVRRADTALLAVGSVAKTNEVYLQATAENAAIQFGNGAAITATSTADGNAATILKKDGVTAADIRKYHVHVYFVAPCSVGTGAAGVCQAGDNTIPTLKRLELRVDGAGNRAMHITPLVDGIQLLKAEWGIDNQPATANVSTGLIGDGVADAYLAAPTLAQISNAVTAKLWVLARNTRPTPDYVDDKSYTVGSATVVAAANDAFKRHVFTTDAAIANMAGRKEIPE
jgi:type IV pilus assembly protein PilW